MSDFLVYATWNCDSVLLLADDDLVSRHAHLRVIISLSYLGEFLISCFDPRTTKRVTNRINYADYRHRWPDTSNSPGSALSCAVQTGVDFNGSRTSQLLTKIRCTSCRLVKLGKGLDWRLGFLKLPFL